MGLAKLSQHLLGTEMSKDLQLSNWTLSQLSDAQVKYAANDALVSLRVYVKFFTLYHNSYEDFTRRLHPFLNQRYKVKVRL